ncbi:endonuclease domain-containing protein [Virgisporangium aliadipatigenens]|uniref:endonuclease domain-containing protein n=1 Tax=Virgisporangium aliadipatigenens TaxID=741659 RepID=UPI0019409494|nr:DUF559 domain-containing protein [Virgisporangium aliadipatigenens]
MPALVLSLDPLPADGPAVLTWTAVAATRPVEVVEVVLAEFDRVARELYPAWLPDARGIDSPAGAGAAAARFVAVHAARARRQSAPFLADLAERSLRSRPPVVGRFGPEVRCAGLARVLAASFARRDAALLVAVPAGLSGPAQQALAAAGRWLADRGNLGVWFAGEPLDGVDWLDELPFCPPGAAVPSPAPAPTSAVAYPPLAGRPHPRSTAEGLLESRLATCDWSGGRSWNEPHAFGPLINPVRLDLVWRRERCVVEIDGPGHRDEVQFASDRERDVLLQLDGYAVLRFTNEQVLHHVDRVLAQIHRFLDTRRIMSPRGNNDV